MQQEPQMAPPVNLPSHLQSPWEKERAQHLTSVLWHVVAGSVQGKLTTG